MFHFSLLSQQLFTPKLSNIIPSPGMSSGTFWNVCPSTTRTTYFLGEKFSWEEIFAGIYFICEKGKIREIFKKRVIREICEIIFPRKTKQKNVPFAKFTKISQLVKYHDISRNFQKWSHSRNSRGIF